MLGFVAHCIIFARQGALDAMKDLGEVMTPAVLGIVSHELRTPLAAIKGFTSLLLRHDGQLSAQERIEMLREIDMAGDRLNNVIEHLLILAELSTDAPQLAVQPVGIFLLVHDMLRQAEQRAQAVGDPPITFTLNRPDTLPDEEPLLVSGDPHYLRLLLEELLENACKFSPHGGAITVTLRLLADQSPFEPMYGGSPAPSRLLISVQDTGIGIPPEDLDRIFTPFFVVDNHLTRAAGGMGIGLALCRRIAEVHGMQIWAENNIQQGSTFHLQLFLS